jgi:DNA (cytosine-5)-methyltransferase 1
MRRLSCQLRGPRRLRVVSLFSGVGGFEKGLRSAGHSIVFQCEADPAARRILAAAWPDIPVAADIRSVPRLPVTDVVTAGFPCQDLSQAGQTKGIGGRHSGLVQEVFRLLTLRRPRWVIFENVPFMLRLDHGRAMRLMTTALETLGFSWAYRIVDTRAFGLPQRRERVFLVASPTEDPRRVILADDAVPQTFLAPRAPRGFYWTEGNRGVGWAINAVPPLKGGSGLGIASPPAIWFPGAARFVTPDIRDAERLQGFRPDWTAPAASEANNGLGIRWRLVGNAVSVPVAAWIGRRLTKPGTYDSSADEPISSRAPLPPAAWGGRGQAARQSSASAWPVLVPYQGIRRFLAHPGTPLSCRAAGGFYRRARASSLRFEDGFLEEMGHYLAETRPGPPGTTCHQS